LNGAVSFADAADEQHFDERLGLKIAPLQELMGVQDVRAGLAFSFPWKNGMVEVQLPKPKIRDQPAVLGINYEFKHDDLATLLSELDNLPPLSELLNHCLQVWGIGSAK
jgi:hypothetical protein